MSDPIMTLNVIGRPHPPRRCGICVKRRKIVVVEKIVRGQTFTIDMCRTCYGDQCVEAAVMNKEQSK